MKVLCVGVENKLGDMELECLDQFTGGCGLELL